MVLLSNAERLLGYQDFISVSPQVRGSVAASKSEVRAALNAIDQWLDDNAASVNAAIPLPARTALTVKQKALLLMIATRRRYGVEV